MVRFEDINDVDYIEECVSVDFKIIQIEYTIMEISHGPYSLEKAWRVTRVHFKPDNSVELFVREDGIEQPGVDVIAKMSEPNLGDEIYLWRDQEWSHNPWEIIQIDLNGNLPPRPTKRRLKKGTSVLKLQRYPRTVDG